MPYAAGTCRDCGAKVTGSSRCAECAELRRRKSAELREERRETGACLVCGDPVAKQKREVGGRRLVRKAARYCGKHLRYYAARAAAAKR